MAALYGAPPPLASPLFLPPILPVCSPAALPAAQLCCSTELSLSLPYELLLVSIEPCDTILTGNGQAASGQESGGRNGGVGNCTA